MIVTGNRWLRAQKPEEFKTLEAIPYPNKKDEKAKFRYFKILECCNFFSNVSDNSTHSVTLLTSYAQDKRDGKDKRDGQDMSEADEIRPPKSVTDSLSKYSGGSKTECVRNSIVGRSDMEWFGFTMVQKQDGRHCHLNTNF